MPDHSASTSVVAPCIWEQEPLNKWMIVRSVVLAGLAAGLLVGCASPYQGGGPASLPGEKTVGALRVGGYNYVAACNVLTRADLESITHTSITAALPGQYTDVSLQAAYATGTYRDSDPYRVYTSTCAWLGTSADTHPKLELEQYPTAALLQLGLRFQAMLDNDLSKALGGVPAFRDPDTRMHAAVIDNKIAKLTATDSTATAILQSVQRRLRELMNKPSPPLDVSRPGGTVAGRPYLSACRLFTPADFTQVLGQTGDSGDIRAELPVADMPANPRRYVAQKNSCEIRRIPDKTPPGTSLEAAKQALNAEALLVEVQVTQIQDVADASQLVREQAGQPVPGVGDEAAFVSSSSGVLPVQYLVVRRGAAVVDLRVTHIRGASMTYEALDTLRRVAAVAVPRMG